MNIELKYNSDILLGSISISYKTCLIFHQVQDSLGHLLEFYKMGQIFYQLWTL